MSINLVVNRKEIERKASLGDFFQGDFSMGWVNTISRQVGHCAVHDAGEDPGEIFDDVSVTVISSSVVNPSEKLREQAQAFVATGGVLVLEMPDPLWSRTFHQKITDGSDKIQLSRGSEGFEIFSFRILPSPYPGILSKMPVCTRTLPVSSSPSSMEVLARHRKSPGVLQYRYQEGWVIILLFDMAMQLSCLRQGVPGYGDYSVSEIRGKVPLVVESDDLVMDVSLMDNLHPMADILENFLFAALEDLTFLPRLWYYPYRYDGVFLMSHDEEKKGIERCRYIFQLEKQEGFVSTFFVISTGNVSQRWPSAQEQNDAGFDIQWHWDRFPAPFSVAPPKEQLDQCRGIPGATADACRIHFLNWGSRYYEPFDEMEKLGIAMDSTLGPNRGRGYVFATGWPFHPISQAGELYNLLEIPFVSQEDWNGADMDFFNQILESSRREYHSTICSIIHPHKGASHTGSVRDLWLGSLTKARKENHWVATFRELKDFHKRRSHVRLTGLANRDPDQVTLIGGFDGISLKLPVYPLEKTGATGELEAGLIPADSDFRVVMETGRKYRLVPYKP